MWKLLLVLIAIFLTSCATNIQPKNEESLSDYFLLKSSKEYVYVYEAFLGSMRFIEYLCVNVESKDDGILYTINRHVRNMSDKGSDEYVGNWQYKYNGKIFIVYNRTLSGRSGDSPYTKCAILNNSIFNYKLSYQTQLDQNTTTGLEEEVVLQKVKIDNFKSEFPGTKLKIVSYAKLTFSNDYQIIINRIERIFAKDIGEVYQEGNYFIRGKMMPYKRTLLKIVPDSNIYTVDEYSYK